MGETSINRRTNFMASPKLFQEMEFMWRKLGYSSRSEFLRTLVQREINDNEHFLKEMNPKVTY